MKRPDTHTTADFPLPQGVPTHVTVPELRLLQRYAHEAGSVLEIGTLYGYTAIGMALAGADVTSVDPHVQSDDGTMDTWEAFLAHCQDNDYYLRKSIADEDALLFALETGTGTIYAFRCAIESTPEFGTLSPFGLVFIDGDHIWPAPMRDARIALAHLRAPGYVAFHDVTPNWPGVWRAVRELTLSGELTEVARERYLRVYQSRASGVSGKSSTPSVAE